MVANALGKNKNSLAFDQLRTVAEISSTTDANPAITRIKYSLQIFLKNSNLKPQPPKPKISKLQIYLTIKKQ